MSKEQAFSVQPMLVANPQALRLTVVQQNEGLNNAEIEAKHRECMS